MITGHALEKGISKETSGDFKKAMIALITPRDEFYAESIHKAIAGLGTNDHKLIRILSYISTNKATCQAVNNFYTHRFKVNIAHDVAGDTSHWYRKTAEILLINRTAL